MIEIDFNTTPCTWCGATPVESASYEVEERIDGAFRVHIMIDGSLKAACKAHHSKLVLFEIQDQARRQAFFDRLNSLTQNKLEAIMSHFTVLVVGGDPEKQLAPFHEFECTGDDNEFIQEVDQTEEALAAYERGTERRMKDPQGNLHDPYTKEGDANPQFYRDPTPEEEKEHGSMMGSGAGGNISWTSKDWVTAKDTAPKSVSYRKAGAKFKSPRKTLRPSRNSVRAGTDTSPSNLVSSQTSRRNTSTATRCWMKTAMSRRPLTAPIPKLSGTGIKSAGAGTGFSK